MTRMHLALGAGLLATVAFVAGHQVGRTGTVDTVTAPPATRAPATTARTIAPGPDKPAPPGIDLGDEARCGFGSVCLGRDQYLMPLRAG